MAGDVHAARHPAHEGRGLVVRKVMPGMALQQVDDLTEAFFGAFFFKLVESLAIPSFFEIKESGGA
jgi:hypothetical protein